MDAGRWISSKQIQQLSGVEGAQRLTGEEDGFGREWYLSNRFEAKGGNRTRASNTSQHMTHDR